MSAQPQTLKFDAAAAAAPVPAREKWILFSLMGIQLTDVLDFMTVTLLGPQIIKAFSVSDAQFALLVSVYSFAAAASGLLSAAYIDKFDRRRLLLVMYALFSLATMSCAFAPSYAALLVSRVFAGMCGGVLLALMQTIIGDVVPYERRGRAMGILMASYPICTVIGVPLMLWMANRFGWQSPFFVMFGLCVVLAVVAARLLPTLTEHLSAARGQSVWRSVRMVLADPNHRLAYAFSALLMFTGFTIIPLVTVFTTQNLGVSMEQVPLIYLCGGIATLLTTPPFYKLTDKRGKVFTFKVLTVVLLAPLIGFTLLPSTSLGLVLAVSTLFFVCMSGRMIPGLAIVNSAADPALRGTFMSINICLQSCAIGLASLIGGLIVSRDAQGMLQNYWMSALVGALACVLTLGLVSRLRLHGAAAEGQP